MCVVKMYTSDGMHARGDDARSCGTNGMAARRCRGTQSRRWRGRVQAAVGNKEERTAVFILHDVIWQWGRVSPSETRCDSGQCKPIPLSRHA